MPINYKEIVESLGDIVFELDLNGHFSYVNKRMTNLTGFSSDELKTIDYYDLVAPFWQTKVKNFYRDQAKELLPDSFLEFPMVTKSGEAFWVAQKVQMSYDHSKRVSRITAVARDIDEQIIMRQELAKKEEVISQLQSMADVGTWELDLTNEKIEWSPQVFQIHDLEEGELPPLDEAINFFDQDSLPIINKAIEKATTTGESYDIKLCLISAKGVKKWVRSIGIPISKNGVVVKLHGLFQDVTIQHLEEARLNLQNADLAKAKEQTEHQTKLKEDHLSAVSHDLRTALNIITSLAKILIRENPRQDQLEYLETLNYSSDNLIGLINDILDFRSIEEGKMRLEIRDLDFKKMLKGFKNSCHQKAKEKGLTFKLITDENIPQFIKADRTRLNQILFNITSNAIKFTANGCVTVTVERVEAPENKLGLKFTIADTGIGIKPEKHSLIFDRFTQSSTGISEDYGGSGLGLNITKNLLELMGSTIQLKSSLGKGSTFYFTIILDASTKTEMTVSSKFTADIFHKEKLLSPFTLLIVDDNEINLLVARKQLEMWGATVVCVNNGQEALNVFDKLNPDLVLMDIQMPVMDGYEASRKIREFNTTTPIIALSASQVSEIEKKAKKCGINHVSSKPIDQTELIQALATLLELEPLH